MEKQEMLTSAKQAKELAKWFKIEFTISIFGHEIIHWIYPPESERKTK